MTHNFNVEVASKVGVECAIILSNIDFWIEKNAANKKHFHDGNYWTYNSAEAFSKLFPYWKPKKIRYLISKLVSDGFLVVGNYNQKKYDRTNWYAITEKGFELIGKVGYDENGELKRMHSEGKTMSQKWEMDVPKMGNLYQIINR